MNSLETISSQIAQLNKQLASLQSKEVDAEAESQQSAAALQSIRAEVSQITDELTAAQKELAAHQQEQHINLAVKEMRAVADDFNSKIIEAFSLFNRLRDLASEAGMNFSDINQSSIRTSYTLPVILHGGVGSQTFRVVEADSLANFLGSQHFDAQTIERLWDTFKH